jgi:hypothetical protein
MEPPATGRSIHPVLLAFVLLAAVGVAAAVAAITVVLRLVRP